ncbi:TIR domain-containing protein [Caballeronia sp. ATUFL_M2_KS44]|uniref:TIR domain-containing protein n=1 Tax=Caballeronia sp. ATUFL_M2_KS44 TaxID=2921767 RepID=UPI002028DFB5|nr:TIR domain-containing protein [Caballeronia sp. ATUFL_M2_KS44]
MSSPVGFWSYARSDDAHSDGHLSQLRTIVGKAIALQYGADITIWQDIQAIPPGADWAASIERTIGQTVFFMPIVTPRYLKSTNCLAEFQSFRQRMIDLGRDDLIFPIHYVNVDQITADDTAFGLDLETLRRHQWIDFRPLRHADCRSHDVWTWVDGLAENILKVAVPVSKAEHAAAAAAIGQAGSASTATDENRQREAARAAERARQQEAAARAVEKARQQEAVEKERERQRQAVRAAEQARAREAAQKPARPEVSDPHPDVISSVDSSGTAVVTSYVGRGAATPVRQRRIGVLAVSAGGLVIVAGSLVAVFLRHEAPQAPTVVPASAPMIAPPASAVAPPASATITTPTPPAPSPPAASNNATPPAKAPDLEGSVDQVLDSAGFIVSGKIVNLYGIRGEDGRPARAMQRYLQSEGNMVRCFAHEEAYQCFANGHDVAVHAVRLGWARTRQGAPPQYDAAEDEARRARAGVWSK